MGDRSGLNRLLDALTSTSPTFCGAAAPPYLVSGLAGIAVGFPILIALNISGGVPLAAAVGFSVVAMTAFTLAGLARRALGRPSHVLLEDVVLVLGVGAGGAAAMDLPILACLDRIVIALGAFLVFGRFGCLASGCCHGRPARMGARYPMGAVAQPLVGMRLFPVQLVEAIWTIVITIAAVGFIGDGGALIVWLVGYASVRFVLEWIRGDVRPSFAGLSEAQWISIGLIAGAVVLEEARAGWRLEALLAFGAAASLVVVGVATRRWWFTPPRPAFDLGSVAAWATTLDELDASARPGAPPVTALRGDIALALELDRGDGGSVVRSYRIAGLDAAGGTLAAGLIGQRWPDARVLRAQALATGFELWLAVAETSRPVETSEPRHLLYRSHAWAAELGATERAVRAWPLPAVPLEPGVPPGSDGSYLRPVDSLEESA